ncbi:RNA chaperone Hfq, partial [Algoriphagus aestuarii]|nr:RNA chaperone Hfq [Algoriphagus aestuarii]
MNLQDSFLREYKESGQEITIFLMNGFQLQGKISD